MFERTDEEERSGRCAETEHRSISHPSGDEIRAVKISPTRTHPTGIGEKKRNNVAKERREGIHYVICGNRAEVTAKRKLDFGDIGMERTVQCKTVLIEELHNRSMSSPSDEGRK